MLGPEKVLTPQENILYVAKVLEISPLKAWFSYVVIHRRSSPYQLPDERLRLSAIIADKRR